jgi:hypothetical protein
MLKFFQDSTEKHKTDLKLFLLDLAMLLTAFGGFFREGFGNDTVWFMVEPQYGINTWYTNGRYLAYALSEVLYKAGFVATDHYKECFLLFILLLAFSLLLYQKVLLPYFENMLNTTDEKAAFLVMTALIFCNVLFTEDFMFTECFLVYPFAYFFAAVGVYEIACRRHKAAGLALLIASSMFYQVALIQAAMVLAVWLALRDQLCFSARLFIREIISSFLIIFIIVVNYFSMKLLAVTGIIESAPKEAGISNSPADKMQLITEQINQFWESSLQLLPPLYLPLFVTGITLIILAAAILHHHAHREMITVILLLIELACLFLLIPFLQDPVVFIPRIVFTIYTAQSMILLISLYFSDGRNKKILSFLVCGWILIQIIFCNVIMANHYLSNQLDLTYTKMVCNKVQNYENETGIQVTKLAVEDDINSPHNYEEVQYKRDQINERALSTQAYSLYCYVSGQTAGMDIRRVDMDPEIHDKYFADRNWDYFDIDQQVIISGDTVYWCVF